MQRWIVSSQKGRNVANVNLSMEAAPKATVKSELVLNLLS